MRRDFCTLLATIAHHDFHRVDRQAFVRVDHHAEKTRIGLEQRKHLRDEPHRLFTYVDQPARVTIAKSGQN